MIEVLQNWNVYIPDPNLLTQRGATFLFDQERHLLYSYTTNSLLSYSSNMSDPLWFLNKKFEWTFVYALHVMSWIIGVNRVGLYCLVITANKVMRKVSCNRCGSLNIRADRALAGRLVCNQCGNLIVKNKSFLHNNSPLRRNRKINPYLIFLVIVLIAVFLI